jgi:DNA helicase IV
MLSDADSLQGEGALLAALNSKRTGRMSDIVGTIQSEQDRIIRSSISGALVVQGGPGTGKPRWPCTGPPICCTPTATG